jgi:dTDP-4-dehydrorhamnose reductase
MPGNVSSEFKERGGTFHLACQGETNWYEYALEIFRQARERGLSLAVKQVRPIPTSAYHVPAKRPLNSRMNCQRLAEQFHLTPPHWKTALGHVLDEFIRLNPRDQELAGRSPLLKPLAEDHAA